MKGEVSDFNLFYEANIKFQYNKENKTSSIHTSLAYRNPNNLPPSGKGFPQSTPIEITKHFSYDPQTHHLIKEVTTENSIKSEKIMEYNDSNQIKRIEQKNKESFFTYTPQGQVAKIETRYKTAAEQHLNSIQYLTFKDNDLSSVTYENQTKGTETIYFKYHLEENFYRNNTPNYTLTESLEDYVPHPIYLLKIKFPDFLENIEFLYQGNRFIYQISVCEDCADPLYYGFFSVLNVSEPNYRAYVKGMTNDSFLLQYLAKF
ncbi:hypothetical protein QNH98_14415 [Myroides sp. mNGS23_01]|nr:hypothetical protein [Myroides sp. mNGS23_01]WHT38232.1 hypothetical protein QNH98_14415 [Myroides sp. mNGS23_01]